MTPKIIHVIAPCEEGSALARRQALFLESIDRAERARVVLLANATFDWRRPGWQTVPLARDARSLGDALAKPFLNDLYACALRSAEPDDWLLYSNIDCALTPDFYTDLAGRRATVVEYQRHDVLGEPATLDALFANERARYAVGLDGLALRASFFAEVRALLPDFVVGEPHWDTAYSEIFRSILPVQRDTTRLLHPKHAQAWSLGVPTPAGAHNQALFVDAVTRGHVEKTIIADAADATDTAVIVVSFGADPVRVAAHTHAISEQLEQDLFADLYLVELLLEGQQSAYQPELRARLHYLPVRGSRACEDLFQKEALMNHGWRTAAARGDYRYFIFADADVYAPQRDWFRQIRAKLRDDPSKAVQGYRIVRDTRDPTLQYSSLASVYALRHQTDLPLNPGLCWGLHRTLLESGDGFNARCIDCAGDSAFVAEYLNSPERPYDPWLYQFAWYNEIERDLPARAEMDCVPVDVRHAYHGDLADRNYDGVRYAIDGFPPLRDLIVPDANGLLTWRDPQCRERAILRQRAAMRSRADVDRLFRDAGYERFARPAWRARPRRPKPAFHGPPSGRPALYRVRGGAAPVPASAEHLEIFRPSQVFRHEFPFSWCSGIRTGTCPTYIPIAPEPEPPRLVLEGAPGAARIAAALPVHASWEPLDLTPFARLELTIAVTAGESDVAVQLVSIDEDGVEARSAPLSLGGRGLERHAPQRFALALADFGAADGFRLDRTRLIFFDAANPCRFELAEIVIR